MPDFYLDDRKTIIECYGDFWHGNPKFFKKGDTTHKNVMVESVWDRDEKRKSIFEMNGYKFISIWEYDIINNLNSVKKIIYENTNTK